MAVASKRFQRCIARFPAPHHVLPPDGRRHPSDTALRQRAQQDSVPLANARACPQPFSIQNPFTSPLRRALAALSLAVVERVLGLSTLNAMYRQVAAEGPERPFIDKALAALGVRSEVGEELTSIPRTGPLIVVANHPLGGLDGLIVASVLRRIRPDVKLLGNSLLEQIPDLRDLFFFVDPFGRQESATQNGIALRSAIRWVRRGGLLAIFPAGEVSHVRTPDHHLVDPAWNPSVGRLVRHARAAVLPIYVHGANSTLFRLTGLVHPRLRTALLPRELLRQRNRTIPVRIGTPIPFDRLEGIPSAEELTDYLRVRTYALRGRLDARSEKHSGSAASQISQMAPPAVPESAKAMSLEVASVPAAQRLCESGVFSVIIGRARQFPHVLREIGRLRELTFRTVGEGTGRPRDVDRFDEHYLHLFVWNRDREEVVGAYRVGPTDEILERFGPTGLYTSTLFWYESRLLRDINPALELGRSFVRAEYQRGHSPLMLLWKGIGRFISLNPRYRRLFGPVSISNEYQSISRQLLMAFLYSTSYRKDLARLVTPRNPPRVRPAPEWGQALLSTVVSGLNQVGTLLAEIESDRKGVPVLLRQYLKLNAKLLGFNVDPTFGYALDALMMVDLMEVDRAILNRYLGRAEAARFVAHHQPVSSQPAA